MLDSIFNNGLSIESVMISLVVAIILGVIIALTHKSTSKYNKNFLVTTSVLPLLVSSVILMVNGSLGAGIATAGAFSLVRFRSIPGSSKEILTVFFAMTIGLSLGMGYVGFASIITIVASLIILILSKIKLFDNDSEKILKVVIPENLDYTNVFDEEFKKYTNKVELEQAKTTNMGSLFELSYKIKLKNNVNEKEFMDDIRVKNGNLKVMISHPLSEGEL